MPSPTPKPPNKRQRRNHVDVRELEVPDVGLVPHPAKKEWDRRTRNHWRKIWASPMAKEYLDVDVEGLYLLMDLYEEYWAAKDVRDKCALESSINRQRQSFGLTPLDRRRLQWEIKRVEAEPVRKPVRPSERQGGDPRDYLRALS